MAEVGASGSDDGGEPGRSPLFRRIDSFHLNVPDIDAGIDFYSRALGQELVWRTDDAAGVRMGQGNSEIVLEKQPPEPSIDLLVDSIDDAVKRFVESGGTVEHGPFEIAVGRAAAVRDPWDNRYVLLDLSKGTFVTDADKRVACVSDAG